ncbi:CDP-alcohol phosphatidyltransferase family protein [Legionella pneumophila]|uniref:CDP-alcohol phosphatidyltransferase family protein n=1 Tax=Legionella pneumophila TaxID=446 RepID=UPI000778808C|nr:CDP-alcohol phosphatidyltransferase family protein [Legionella pneumophila]HAT8606382.1 hypothetical protein [Legionella pneumophila]
MELFIRKPKETTEWINRFFIHPVSMHLVRFILPTKITPNQLSLLGLFHVLAGGYCLLRATSSYFYFFLSFLFFSGRMVCDAGDGQLARFRNTSSERGTMIDGLCDYVSFAIIYGLVAYLYYPDFGPLIFLFIFLSGLSSAFQATSYQLYLDLYTYIKYQHFGAKLRLIVSGENNKLSYLLQCYNKAQLSFFNKNKLLLLLSEKYPINNKLKTQLTDMLPKWHLLAGNYRYFLLTLLINHIEWYFFIETILLNITLFFLVKKYNQVLEVV